MHRRPWELCDDCVRHGMPALPSGRDALIEMQGGDGGLDGGCGMGAAVLLTTGEKWEGTVWHMAPCFSRADWSHLVGGGYQSFARMRTVPG